MATHKLIQNLQTLTLVPENMPSGTQLISFRIKPLQESTDILIGSTEYWRRKHIAFVDQMQYTQENSGNILLFSTLDLMILKFENALKCIGC